MSLNRLVFFLSILFLGLKESENILSTFLFWIELIYIQILIYLFLVIFYFISFVKFMTIISIRRIFLLVIIILLGKCHQFFIFDYLLNLHLKGEIYITSFTFYFYFFVRVLIIFLCDLFFVKV